MMENFSTEGLITDLKAYHQRFYGYFARPETRDQAGKYLEGLITSKERRNTWEIAESVGDRIPDATQRLLYHAKWDTDGVRDEHQQFCKEKFGHDHGIFIFDETGFLKFGKHSAGVARQYTGTAGKITNCQVGTFLAYKSYLGRALLDRRLYIPQEWFEDRERCDKAKIPEELLFQTKPQHAVEMLQHAKAQGFPGDWVTADEVYGNSREFRQEVATLGMKYVVAVKCNVQIKKLTRVPGDGRPPLSFWPEGESWSVEKVARNLPAKNWKKLVTGAGEKGPIEYYWGAVRVQVEGTGEESWLLIRRSLKDRDDMAFYFSNAGPTTKIKTLARVAAARFEVELCFLEAKSEAGLDEYEVRRYDSWYRHITLSMMVHAFLSSEKKTQNTPQFSKNCSGGSDNAPPSSILGKGKSCKLDQLFPAKKTGSDKKQVSRPLFSGKPS